MAVLTIGDEPEALSTPPSDSPLYDPELLAYLLRHVRDERLRQLELDYAGEDLMRSLGEWVVLLRNHLDECASDAIGAEESPYPHVHNFRVSLVRVAALALAALEQVDRQNPGDVVRRFKARLSPRPYRRLHKTRATPGDHVPPPPPVEGGKSLDVGDTADYLVEAQVARLQLNLEVSSVVAVDGIDVRGLNPLLDQVHAWLEAGRTVTWSVEGRDGAPRDLSVSWGKGPATP